MDQTIYLVTLVGTALVLAAAFSSLVAFRYGAPLLLLFLGIGLASGTDGLGIEFDNANVAYFVVLPGAGRHPVRERFRYARLNAAAGVRAGAHAGDIRRAADDGPVRRRDVLPHRLSGWNPSCSARPSRRPTRRQCFSCCAPAISICATGCARRWKSSPAPTTRSPSS